jgi:ADP-ribose pyrophosphatase
VSEPTGIEVVRDESEGSRLDQGFLRLKRYVLRTTFSDGTASREYAYDVVSRRQVDAVAVVPWEVGPDARVRVLLKTGARPPVGLRARKDLVQPDAETRLALVEIVAGLLEDEDRGPGGVERRAAIECREEAGLDVLPGAMEDLGAALFPSPGITDEKVHFRAVRADLGRRGRPVGDGSVLEEHGGVLVLDLEDAIRRCRSGEVPDMKTEVALVRLRDRLRDSAPPGPAR